MVAAVEHLPADVDPADIHTILERDGALVIDGLAGTDLIDRIAAEMAAYVEATPHGSDDFSGRTTKRTGGLVGRSPASRQLVQHPLILDVTGRLLHRARAFQLHLTQIISIGPDSPAKRSTATSGPSTSSSSPPTTPCSATPSGR